MYDVHGLRAHEYSSLIANEDRIRQWRQDIGYTDLAGQCGFCLQTFSRGSIKNHLRKCKPSSHYPEESLNIVGDQKSIELTGEEIPYEFIQNMICAPQSETCEPQLSIEQNNHFVSSATQRVPRLSDVTEPELTASNGLQQQVGLLLQQNQALREENARLYLVIHQLNPEIAAVLEATSQTTLDIPKF